MKLKKILLILCGALLLLSLTSCGALDDDEAREVLSDLLPKAAELNEIIWGAGLPPAETPEASAAGTAKYAKVSADCGYSTLAELRAAAEAVFSAEFMEIINTTAFDGTEETFPRYNETTDGVLQVNTSEKGFTLRSTLYPDRARVLYGIGDLLKVAVPCDFDGKPADDYEIILVRENGLWKIDSPTY